MASKPTDKQNKDSSSRTVDEEDYNWENYKVSETFIYHKQIYHCKLYSS